MASACLVLGAWLLLPTVHEAHALAYSSQHKTTTLLDPGLAAAGSSRVEATSAEHRVYPYVIDDAVVTGVADEDAQAALHAGLPPPGLSTRRDAATSADSMHAAQRSLLHGTRKPWKYSVCNRCTIVNCNSGNCSGHCKKNKKLYYCRSRARAFRDCDPVKPKDVPTLPIDPLGDYDSAIVTATAPYIGCANIKDKPSGCPERLTRTRTEKGGRVVVLKSECKTENYAPDCFSPHFPYGICECRVVVTKPKLRIVNGPCDFTLLAGKSGVIESPRRRRKDEDPEVVVESLGDVISTGFIDFIEEGEEPDYVYKRMVEVAGGEVDVMLEIFKTEIVHVNPKYDVLEEEEDFSEEYDEEYGDGTGGSGHPDSGESGGSGGDGDGETSTSTSSSTSTSTKTVVRSRGSGSETAIATQQSSS